MLIQASEVELRKVQRLGSSSHIVTLPASWVKKLNIKPGEYVAVEEDGEFLKIRPLSKESNLDAGLRITSAAAAKSVLNDEALDCIISLGFQRVDLVAEDLDFERIKEIEKKLKDRFNADVSVTRNGISVILANGESDDQFALLKELASVAVKSIDFVHSARSPEERRVYAAAAQRVLESKFLALKKSIMKTIISERGEGASRALAIEFHSLLSNLEFAINELLEALKEANGFGQINEKAGGRILDLLKEAVWEMLAGLANKSVKRIETARASLREAYALLDEESHSRNDAVVALKALIKSMDRLAARAAGCQTLARAISGKVAGARAKERVEAFLPKI